MTSTKFTAIGRRESNSGRIALLAGAAVATAATAAHATLTFSFDEMAFAAAATNSDDFSAYLTPGDGDLDLTGGPTQLGDFIYTPIGSTDGFGDLEIRDPGAGDPAEDNSLFAFLDGSPDNFSFSITSASGLPFNGFGANFTSAASFGGTTVSLDNGDSFNIGDQLADPATGFLGWTSDTTFSTITFSVTNDSDFEGIFFETIYADIVPTPGVLSIAGLAGVAAARRRR